MIYYTVFFFFYIPSERTITIYYNMRIVVRQRLIISPFRSKNDFEPESRGNMSAHINVGKQLLSQTFIQKPEKGETQELFIKCDVKQLTESNSDIFFFFCYRHSSSAMIYIIIFVPFN